MKSRNILHFCLNLVRKIANNTMKILMLCLGNICRSPLAEGIMRSKLPESFEIDSAGTISYHEGKKADHRSIKIAEKYGVDINKHRARIITPKDLDEYDKIFCMDLENYKDAVSMAKSEEQRQKISLILNEAGNIGDNIEVPDPYWSELDAFDQVYKMLDEACDKIAKKLTSE